MRHKIRCAYCARSTRNVESVEVRRGTEGVTYAMLCQRCRDGGEGLRELSLNLVLDSSGKIVDVRCWMLRVRKLRNIRSRARAENVGFRNLRSARSVKNRRFRRLWCL